MALEGTSGRLEVDRFLQDLGASVALVGWGFVGFTRSVYRRQSYTHFVRFSERLMAQSFTNFLSLMGPRAHEHDMAAEHKQCVLGRGSRFKGAWKAMRKKVPEGDKLARRRDAALSASGLRSVLLLRESRKKGGSLSTSVPRLCRSCVRRGRVPIGKVVWGRID